MGKQTIIDKFDFKRAISVSGPKEGLHPSQQDVIEQIENFGIDEVYFSQDGDNYYPAVFIKKVSSFDPKTLKQIADVHKNIWNYKKVSFLYAYNDTEIRIYNCVEIPVFITNETNYEEKLKKRELTSCNLSDKMKVEELSCIFSSIAIDSGSIWSIESAIEYRNKITLQQRVDQYLIKSLTNTAQELKAEGLNVEVIHRIILRSLFLLYLEDRGATDKNFYTQIKTGAKSYFDILEDVEKTYLLFEKLEKHFNGNVFSVEDSEIKKVQKKHLSLIRQCFISGFEDTSQLELFPNWRLFDFSIIQIELLSQIYENFLSEFDSERKSASGVYYTPPSLVELILNEKLPIDTTERQYDLKILDPACGSGIFLVECFKRLVKRYENAHNVKLTDFETLKRLITDNIYGIEYDSNAIKVATFSLYLALVERLNPKTLWRGKKLPYLINDPDDKTLRKQGKNLYRRDTIKENKEIERIAFDLVVGNPPFGTRNLLDSIHNYCDTNQFAKEKVLPFLHKSVQFAPNGEIAMIFNTKILTNTGTTYQNFRKWLMQECYVEKLYNFSILRKSPKDFGGQLFGNAVGPISIVFYRKEQPQNPSNKIVYYAPKTYLKSNVLEGIVIESTDVKYLPREECQKPNTKIWKIAMWGGMADWELIKKISSMYENTLESVFTGKDKQWDFATGLNADSEHLDFVPQKVIDTKKINRYYTPKAACYSNTTTYRKLEERYFNPPFVVIKQAQSEKQITASYIDYNAYCLSSAYVINGVKIPVSQKKALVAILNSAFSKYFFFMLASSWGIERERIQANEILLLLYILNNFDESTLTKINNKVDQIIDIKKNNHFLREEEIIREIEADIDTLLFNDVLKLSQNERISINDALTYSLGLFEKQHKSEAILPTLDTELYAKMLCSELNDFLDNQRLFANATIYNIGRVTPLMMIKLSHAKTPKNIIISNEKIDDELKNIHKYLLKKEAINIYFRKKLNYKKGDDIYIIRPNQRRFWSRSMALEDASELILEILNGEHDAT